MYIAIITTVVLVSLDAIFVGMSLKLQKDFKPSFIFIISGILVAMSITAYFVAGALAGFMDFETSWLVGGAFLLLGVRNLFAKDEEKMNLTMGAIIILGLVMSIDCVIATVVLTIDQPETFFTPVIVSFGHFVFLLAGCLAAKFIKTSHKVHNIISASCLFLVAVLNFTGIL